jgi:hypothetical protein
VRSILQAAALTAAGLVAIASAVNEALVFQTAHVLLGVLQISQVLQ